MPVPGMTVWDADCAEKRSKFAVGMKVTRTQRHSSFAVLDQMAGSRTDRRQPVGNIMWITDRRGEEEQSGLRRTENDGFLPDNPALGIRQILGFIHDHETKGIEPDVDLAARCVVQEVP